MILVASGTLPKDSREWALENNNHLPESLELIIAFIVRNSPEPNKKKTPTWSCKNLILSEIRTTMTTSKDGMITYYIHLETTRI